jgi:S-adenosylmethionine:tRNA ribosyltransferase-isomerase
MSLLTSDYDYTLPEDLIARHPLPDRDGSRMLVLHRKTQQIEHLQFRDFPSFLEPSGLVVLNNTRVIPARVFSDDRGVELLFLEATDVTTWKCLVKPGRKMRVGHSVSVLGVRGTVTQICPEGERLIKFEAQVDLEAAGEIPLPPYFERSPEPADLERYQTVFATEKGAVAAPTAGLHFTPEILATLPHSFVTLHVGAGTFRPVQTDDLSQHRMHSERFHVSPEAAAAINSARTVTAIGTTTTRVLESLGRPVPAGSGETDIFLHPPCTFRVVDHLLTNFHLPKSTLLMLVSAMAGREFILEAYRQAVALRYRFYSYGDCMLIL